MKSDYHDFPRKQRIADVMFTLENSRFPWGHPVEPHAVLIEQRWHIGCGVFLTLREAERLVHEEILIAGGPDRFGRPTLVKRPAATGAP